MARAAFASQTLRHQATEVLLYVSNGDSFASSEGKKVCQKCAASLSARQKLLGSCSSPVAQRLSPSSMALPRRCTSFGKATLGPKTSYFTCTNGLKIAELK